MEATLAVTALQSGVEVFRRPMTAILCHQCTGSTCLSLEGAAVKRGGSEVRNLLTMKQLGGDQDCFGTQEQPWYAVRMNEQGPVRSRCWHSSVLMGRKGTDNLTR
ncbi:hypothetical protein LIA77_08548 [Sarocladium implicatum]|nr:hypothetical protein LIA77_08548 [Sarocladium implicatum]